MMISTKCWADGADHFPSVDELSSTKLLVYQQQHLLVTILGSLSGTVDAPVITTHPVAWF